jgi:RimJ/RimL family protein N-acetyltransferase
MLPAFQVSDLVLQPRTVADIDAVVALNSDEAVMRYIAPVGDPLMSAESVTRRSFAFTDRGLGYWSVRSANDPADFLGYVGLIPAQTDMNALEISYRFHQRVWGKGIARMAAARIVRYAFEDLVAPVLMIITHPENSASLRLAERLGFQRAANQPAFMMGRSDADCAILTLKRTQWQGRSVAPE